MSNELPHILCPMAMESRAVRSLAQHLGWSVTTTGIGGEAVRRIVESTPPETPLILAGVAGALRPDLHAGSAYRISEVVTARGILTSPLASEGLRVTGADGVIATPDDKQALAERTGACLVDMESHDFAEAATEAGLRWAIYRGVSDGMDHSLPPGCDKWFSPEGRLRWTRAALSLSGKPTHVPSMIAFGMRTRNAMKAVRDLVAADARLLSGG